MITLIRSKRIVKGGYSPGDQMLITGPLMSREEDLRDTPKGPSPAEIEREMNLRVDAAREKAFQEGFLQGTLEGRHSIEGEVSLLQSYVEQLEIEAGKVWDNIEQYAADLAMEIGRKIVGRAVEAHRSLALELAEKGIAMARAQTKINLLVNPDDAAMLREATAELLRVSEGVRQIDILERASIARGGIIVESDIGQLDLRPDVQLEAISQRLETSIVENCHGA